MNTFWMIYVEGRTGSTYKQQSSLAAKTEAERLARLPDNQGRNVYVLRAENVCSILPPEPPLQWKTLR